MTKDKFAHIIRIISAPPFMVTTLLIILINSRNDIFINKSSFVVPLIFLGFFPVLAYPAAKAFYSHYKGDSRTLQRKLAFIFSLLGYAVAFVWALVSEAPREIMLICSTYFLSVFLLAFTNKILHLRASGHACSVTGPLIFLVYFVNWKILFPAIVFAALIVWSSLYLKRHTRIDLFLGCIICILSFFVSNMFVSLKIII